MDLEDYKIFRQHGKDYWWFKGKRDLLDNLLSDLRLNKRDSKILDIGCGIGEDLGTIGDYGRVYAIEYSLDAIKLVNKKLLDGLFCNDATKLCFKDKTFNTVVIMDVLEHLDDDRKAFNEAARVLKKNGYLIISVPAVEFLFGPHDRRLKHRRRYSRKMLCKMIKSRNMKIVRFSYWNSFLFIPIFFVRFYKKFFNIERSDLTELNPFLNKIFTNILFIEDKIIKAGYRLPIGLSMIVVLKKTGN
ncbi:class I SAM-dependent methyltransferase [Candidatus Woesearchaeota archaeon]|nr:class I SAM-dependent methyltransferase [Candidatus Woesearchaeota archaeon]